MSFFSTCILVSSYYMFSLKIKKKNAKFFFSRLVVAFSFLAFDIYGQRVIEPPCILQFYVLL
jgi:hypothetical protein